ncbi:MAG: hypothetical protein M1479_09500 [Actinobacteria bacterium]|nr:hypothetical protein [Cyanobacteriota bacterium]MCL5772488.1 hypothetical protein [Actinomycetota bacterium]
MMFNTAFYGNFFPAIFILRLAFSAAFVIFAILTIVFWVIFAAKKYKWAKITAIVVSSISGLIFICGIAGTVLTGFMAFNRMPLGRDMFHHFNNLRNGIRRY